MSEDAAHILFPNDAPKSSETPDWFRSQQAAAEVRLMRATPATSEPDRTKGDTDAATILFKNEVNVDYDHALSAELDNYTLDAIKEGDRERADALKSATSALAANFQAAGTEKETLQEAFQIIRETTGFAPLTQEQSEASFAQAMTAVQQAGISDADLGVARAFVRDLEIVSPGVIASLEAHGAGNDIRMIRAAIKEAKRRGYR